MTKAKMPVIMCPNNAAKQAAGFGLWTAHRRIDDGNTSLRQRGGTTA